MFRSAALAVIAAASFSAATAAAAEGDAGDWNGGYGESGKVRSDFTLGLSAGLLTGRAIGYPNRLSAIDNPAYRANTHFGAGTQYTLWLGGAIKDWFVLSAGLSNGALSGNHREAGSFSYLARVEAYPLFAQGGVFQDLGVVAHFGIGSGVIQRNDQEVANGGAMSVVGVGLMYETWHLGHFALGPTLDYEHRFSQSMRMDTLMLGVRVAYYSRPSKP
jgi:hypothetical protein